MENVIRLFTNSEDFAVENHINAQKAVYEIWQDADVRKALKNKILEHIEDMSGFDMTYQTGFKDRVMPNVFSDNEVQKVLREQFMKYLVSEDIDYDLGQALACLLLDQFKDKK